MKDLQEWHVWRNNFFQIHLIRIQDIPNPGVILQLAGSLLQIVLIVLGIKFFGYFFSVYGVISEIDTLSISQTSICLLH